MLEGLKATISGSFRRYKPEIDLAIAELKDLGVQVLAPEPGWLYLPRQRILTISSESRFRPLPNERHMSIRQIEDDFLRCVAQSDFLYVVNPEGYVGVSACMEIGFAIARGIPVFAQQPINLSLDLDPVWRNYISMIPCKSLSEIVGSIGE